jgi:hypothetical protein
VEGREITYSDFAVWEGPDLTSLPATPTAAGHDAAARFADALEGRAAASTMKGPWWDTLVRRPGSPTLWKVQIAPEDFSGTITFVNPTELTETPWDYGFAFHPVDNALQNVFVDSDGFWCYQGTRAG